MSKQASTKKLEGKIAVITGGTRGFGLALARAFGNAGASVAIASRSPESVENALRILNQEGIIAAGFPCDVAEREQVQALASQILARYGRFDIWINNAGIAGVYGPTLAIEPEAFVSVIRTNITGTYNGSVAAMRHFLPRGEGKLINILGRGDKGPQPMQNAYASSKMWVRSFTLALAKEYERSGVSIIAFSPGLMWTEMMSDVQVVAGYEGRLKPLEMVMRMWANPPEVPARQAVDLASEETDGRTGIIARQITLGHILKGLAREGVRRVLHRAAPEYHLKIEPVPAAFGDHAAKGSGMDTGNIHHAGRLTGSG